MHLILLGAPGSGKGTYAVELKKHYGIPHISTGEIFREEIASKSELGFLAKSLIDKGEFVPDDVTIEIVTKRLLQDDCKHGFILDGFPRTLQQAKALTEFLPTIGKKIDAVVNLEIKDEEVVKRIVNRLTCPKCKRGYNLLSLPPKEDGICDDCKVALVKRADDNEQTISSRLAIYHERTQVLIDYYKKLGLIISIDSNKSIQDVTNSIIVSLEEK